MEIHYFAFALVSASTPHKNNGDNNAFLSLFLIPLNNEVYIKNTMGCDFCPQSMGGDPVLTLTSIQFSVILI